MSGSARAAAGFELRARTRACVQLVDVHGKDVLDVGCSFGWFCRHAVQADARSVTGVDLNEESLAVARQYAPGASFLRASALDLPFERGTFDVVALFEVIEHLERGSEERALREAHRILRDRGVLALSTPGRSMFGTYTDPAFYKGHRHYEMEEVVRLVERAGFELRDVWTAGALFDQLDLLLYYVWRHTVGRERHPLHRVRLRADEEWRHRRGNNTILLVASRAAA